MEKEVFLVEELENRLAIEAANYQHKISEEWQTAKFDPTYFDTFISGDLYNEFVQTIYERTKPLNNHEINRILTLSLAQFNSHTPEKREQSFILNYHNTYWFPNVVEFKANEYDVQFAQHVWKHYTKHFHLFKAATIKAIEDFKAGFIGMQSNPVKTNDINIKNITYTYFDEFIKLLEFDIEHMEDVISFKEKIESNIVVLKQEILENLINLSKDDRKPYLKRLLYIINVNKSTSRRSQEEIDYCLELYGLESEDYVYYNSAGEELKKILSTKNISLLDISVVKDMTMVYEIKLTFYDNHSIRNTNEIIAFIDEQMNEYNLNPISSTINTQQVNTKDNQTPKLKTNLTVPEIAFLFKMLKELKPQIFNTESDAELFRFISANFETKRSTEEGISTQKLRNLFSDPELKAVKFWEKHFHTFIAEVKKYK